MAQTIYLSNSALDNLPNTDVTGSSGAVTSGAATASMPAVANRTNYLTGFDVTGTGTVTATTVTVTGVGSGTMTYAYSGGTLSIEFDEPIASSAANTAVVVTVTAVGGTTPNVCVNVYGFLI